MSLAYLAWGKEPVLRRLIASVDFRGNATSKLQTSVCQFVNCGHFEVFGVLTKHLWFSLDLGIFLCNSGDRKLLIWPGIFCFSKEVRSLEPAFIL